MRAGGGRPARSTASRRRPDRAPGQAESRPLRVECPHASGYESVIVGGEESKSIQRRILELQTEHRDLDDVVNSLSNRADVDQLLLRRMKKRKLQLKDQIARLKSRLIPDLDA